MCGKPSSTPRAIYDEDTERWISKAEVAEVNYTAFSSKKAAGQDLLFTAYRYHGVFSTVPKEVLNTADMDKTHRQHGGHRSRQRRVAGQRLGPHAIRKI